MNVSLNGNRRHQVATLDKAIFGIIGNLGNLFQWYIARLSQVNRQTLHLCQILAVFIGQTQIDINRAIALIELGRLRASHSRINLLRDRLARNAQRAQFILIEL